VVRKLLVAGVVAGTVLALAGCASSKQVTGASGIESVPTSSAPSPKPAAPTPTVAPTPTPAPSPSSSVAKLAKACTVGEVSVKPSTGQGAAGTQVQRFIVKNTASAPCTMAKYPFISPYGLVMQGKSKVEATLVNIKVTPIASDFGDLGAAGGIRTLAPGDTSVFFLKWSDVPVGSNPCDDADGFDFRPPQDSSINDNKTVPLTFTVCGGSVQVSQMLSPSVGS
jgi:uncharacterized protein DUF4232